MLVLIGPYLFLMMEFLPHLLFSLGPQLIKRLEFPLGVPVLGEARAETPGVSRGRSRLTQLSVLGLVWAHSFSKYIRKPTRCRHVPRH